MLLCFIQKLLCLAADRRAVSAIEYAFIAALIAVAVVGGSTSLGQSISASFNTVSAEL